MAEPREYPGQEPLKVSLTLSTCAQTGRVSATATRTMTSPTKKDLVFISQSSCTGKDFLESSAYFYTISGKENKHEKAEQCGPEGSSLSTLQNCKRFPLRGLALLVSECIGMSVLEGGRV